MHRALFLGSLALAFVAGATALRLSPQAQAANELRDAAWALAGHD